MSRAQLVLISAVFLIGICSAVLNCHVDDLRKSMINNTEKHKELVTELVDTLTNSSYGTLTAVDLAEVLRGSGDSYYSEQAEKYVHAVKKIYELSFKLKGNIQTKSVPTKAHWEKIYKIAFKIFTTTKTINKDCFDIKKTFIVDKSGDEAKVVQKLLKAVLEMFIAETFLNEHFNHLQNPLSKN